MRNLQEATEKICELKGSLVAVNALLAAILKVLPDHARQELLRTFSEHSEVLARAFFVAAHDDHCTRTHMLLLTNDSGNALVAEVRERLLWVLQIPRPAARL